MPTLQPFVKWAGGKRQLIAAISERMPRKFNNYFEPFIGGGAVLFHFLPERAVINDINSALINTYLQLRDNPEQVMNLLDRLDLGQLESESHKEYYYEIRKRFNMALLADDNSTEVAALFIYINKHCFNGLYRVNAKGCFNVPFNNSKTASYSEDNILAVSDYLKNINILCGDFEIACAEAKEGDFIFFDSPYAPLNPTSFESYTKEGFSQENHVRLANLYRKLSDKGCYCMLTNHNTELINELYKDYFIDVVQVKRFINSDASKRTGTEVIIRNY